MKRAANDSIDGRIARATAHHIVREGNPKVLKRAFLGLGKDPNVQDAKGETPLFLAVSLDDLEAVDILIKAGADPDLRDQKGVSALDLSRQMRSSPDLILKLEGASQKTTGKRRDD